MRWASAHASPTQEERIMSEASLYDRLGGVFAIAAVVDHFSDAIIENAAVGKLSRNPQLNEWSNQQPERLPGLKWMRTLWVCEVSGGPYKYVATKPGRDSLSLEEGHRKLRITSEEFDEVAAELARSLDHFNVPEREKSQVRGAVAAQTGEVIEGSLATVAS
jgi:hemoglobin